MTRSSERRGRRKQISTPAISLFPSILFDKIRLHELYRIFRLLTQVVQKVHLLLVGQTTDGSPHSVALFLELLTHPGAQIPGCSGNENH